MHRPSKQSAAPAPAPTLAVHGGPLKDDAVQTQCELRAFRAAISPRELQAALADAAALVLFEPLRFPFESLRETDWEVPVVAALPEDRGAASLLEALGERLLGRLTFFDRIATNDDALWALLRERFGWGQCQRIDSSDQAEIVRAVDTFHSVDALERMDRGEPAPDPGSSCRSRREEPVDQLPYRVAEGAHLTLREHKAVHLSQKQALQPVLGAAHELISREGRLRMLEVRAEIGQRASLVRSQETELIGVDPRSACVRVAGENFPEHEFLEIGDLAEMPFPDQRFELVLSVMALQRAPYPVRCPLVTEMWRVLGRGGWVVFVEEVVQGGAEEAGTSAPLRVEDLETLIVEGSGGGALLEHFEAVRYPHDDAHRAALVVCSKISGLEDPVRLRGLKTGQAFSR